MTQAEVLALNEGRYKFRKEHTSTKAAPWRRMPGHVLVEEFIAPHFPADLSDLSRMGGISLHRLNKLVRGQTKIDQGLAEKLATFFGNDASYWLDLQARYDRGEKL